MSFVEDYNTYGFFSHIFVGLHYNHGQGFLSSQRQHQFTGKILKCLMVLADYGVSAQKQLQATIVQFFIKSFKEN
jgi:hypothetical protein